MKLGGDLVLRTIQVEAAAWVFRCTPGVAGVRLSSASSSPTKGSRASIVPRLPVEPAAIPLYQDHKAQSTTSRTSLYHDSSL